MVSVQVVPAAIVGGNSLEGGTGNDQRAGGKGNDAYLFPDGLAWTRPRVGQWGTDRFRFSAATRGVTYLRSTTVRANNGLDTVTGNVENIRDGSGRDTLVSVLTNNTGTSPRAMLAP